MADVSQQPQSNATDSSKQLRSYLERDDFQRVLQQTVAKGLDHTRLCRLAIQVVARGDDKLQRCSILSIADAVLQAGELGLEVGSSVLGHAFLVPFQNKKQNPPTWEAKLIVSYKGKAELARRSGLVQRIEARVVHEKDLLRVRAGTSPRLTHRWGLEDRGPVIGFYAVAFFKDGSRQFEIVSRAEVDRIRNAAPSKDSPAWQNHYDEMGKKTAAHRLEKYLPLSPEQQRSHDLDEEEGDIVQGKVVPFAQAPAAPLPEPESKPKPHRSPALAAAQASAKGIELPLPNGDGVLVGKTGGAVLVGPTGTGSAGPVPGTGPALKPAEFVDPGPCVLTEGCSRPAGHKPPCATPTAGIPKALCAECGGRDGKHKASCSSTAAAKPTGKEAAAEPRMREPGED